MLLVYSMVHHIKWWFMSRSIVYPIVYQSHLALCPSALSGQNSTETVCLLSSLSLSRWPRAINGILLYRSRLIEWMGTVIIINTSHIFIFDTHTCLHTFAVSAFPQHVRYRDGPKINKFVTIESREKNSHQNVTLEFSYHPNIFSSLRKSIKQAHYFQLFLVAFTRDCSKETQVHGPLRVLGKLASWVVRLISKSF